MTTIEMNTFIKAPVATCFHLALRIDLELDAAEEYGLKAIGGVTEGSIGLHERVTWTTKQFGVSVTHTSEITSLNEPQYFQDVMVEGIFRSFRHEHLFEALDTERTKMQDRLCFSMPWYLMGHLTERLIVRERLVTLLSKRNMLLKNRAEIDSEMVHKFNTVV